MIDSLANLLAVIEITMAGGYALQGELDLQFWPATAGCLYVLVLVPHLKS